VFELERHRTFGAHVAAVFAEDVAHFGHRTDAVVGHGVDNDGSATDAIAFVTDFFVIDTFEVAGGLVDVAFDRVGRHVGRLGLFDGQPQARIGCRITTAGAGGHHDLADHPGPDTLALFVLSALAVLNICPFAVAGHHKPFCIDLI